MSKSSNPLLAGMLLLILVPVASSFAAAPAAGNEAAAAANPGSVDSHSAAAGAYASEDLSPALGRFKTRLGRLTGPGSNR